MKNKKNLILAVACILVASIAIIFLYNSNEKKTSNTIKIKEWQEIEKRKKYKQLELKL